tara:strand:- start:40 stop:342 length:303 start_codon:yes stop_codon:yes gene_type:complete
MFLAMNRFKIAKGFEPSFEKLWRERESYLDEVDGFQSFSLLKGSEETDYTLYASHTTWKSEKHFLQWTESDSFKKAHRQAKAPKGTYMEHPKLELFHSII